MPLFGHHDVVGFQVAVGDALLVGSADRIGDGNSQLQELRQSHASLREKLGEPFPLNQLHRDEVDALGLLHRMDGNDVRMVEGGDGLGLSLETPA